MKYKAHSYDDYDRDSRSRNDDKTDEAGSIQRERGREKKIDREREGKMRMERLNNEIPCSIVQL